MTEATRLSLNMGLGRTVTRHCGGGITVAWPIHRSGRVGSGFDRIAVFAGLGLGLRVRLRIRLRLRLGRLGLPGPATALSLSCRPVLGWPILGWPILGWRRLLGWPILGWWRFLGLLAVERGRFRLLPGIPRHRFAGRLGLTVAAAAAGLAVAVGLGIVVGVDDAVVVLGVLIVRLSRDTIPKGSRIARQPDVLLVNLVGVAANPALGTGAVEIAVARRATMLLALRPPARSPSV